MGIGYLHIHSVLMVSLIPVVRKDDGHENSI